MNLGVLLLYTQDGRVTSFTRDWADLAVGRVAKYMSDQSGGRETITYKVFDWIKLDQTAAEWHGLGFDAYKILKPDLERKLGVSLDQYTHILIGIDEQSSSGGSTPGAITHLAASNFTPSLIAHELGHRYGAGDAFRETTNGPRIYENRFCVMGAVGWPAVFADRVLADPNASMLNQNGPNMSAPTLIATGWLKEDDHGVGLDLTNYYLTRYSGTTTELSALSGAPGQAWTRPPLLIRYQDLLIEYRVGGPSAMWDQGLPDPGSGAGGWIVVHRSLRANPSAVYVNSIEARPGNSLVTELDYDLFKNGPLKISVLSYNATDRTVRLQFSRRAARPLPSTVYEGIGIKGVVSWTPEGGFKPLPPHSPLVKVLKQVAKIQSLQELMTVASGDEVTDLSKEAMGALRDLQESVADLSLEPVLSPLAQALEYISQLERTSERLERSLDNKEQLIESIDMGRQRLAELKQIIATVVEEENRVDTLTT